MLWIRYGRRALAGCVFSGWGSMPATARNGPLCGRWVMNRRCLFPTSAHASGVDATARDRVADPAARIGSARDETAGLVECRHGRTSVPKLSHRRLDMLYFGSAGRGAGWRAGRTAVLALDRSLEGPGLRDMSHERWKP